MIKFILKRILYTIPVLLGVTLLIFVLLSMAPGEPAITVLGATASEEDIAHFNEVNGLDKPLIVQYVRYLGGVLEGNLGTSYVGGRSVTDILKDAFPVTLQLVLCATAFMVILGLPLGIISAYKQNSVLDNIAQTLGIIGVSMPGFWLGLMLIIEFAVNQKLLPPSGWSGPKSWILPAITVGLSGAASMMRITRSSMLDVIRQDYIRTARAKGQNEFVVVCHHMLRNALLPIITVVGTTMGSLFGGCMAVETIFSIPGLSRQLINSIYQRDYPVVQGAVLLIAAMCTVINLLVDIIYAMIDARIRSQYQNSGKKKAARVNGGTEK